MDCPACREALTSATYLQVPVHLCKLCDGLWVTTQNLERIKKTPRVFDDKEVVKVRLLREYKLIEGEQPSPHGCPSCGVRLVRSHYRDIPSLILDKCPVGCGVWMDKDELEHIQILEKQGG